MPKKRLMPNHVNGIIKEIGKGNVKMKKWIAMTMTWVFFGGCTDVVELPQKETTDQEIVDTIPSHRLPVEDGFRFPQADCELDVMTVGRIDLNGDGTMEQIVVDSGGGTGGPSWHIRLLNGFEISPTMSGMAQLAYRQGTYPDILTEYKIGCNERHFCLYRFNGEEYQCIRHEVHDYELDKVTVLK